MLQFLSPRWRQRILPAIGIILLQGMLFGIWLQDAAIIRSDGPSGFGELFLKGLITMASLPIGFISALGAGIIAKSQQTRRGWWLYCVLATLWFLLFALVAIYDACADNGGYCRHWQLYFPA